MRDGLAEHVATLKAEMATAKAALLEAKWRAQCIRRRVLAASSSRSNTFP